MRRHGIPFALLFGFALLLSGCSLLPGADSSRDDPESDDESSETLEISARDLEELVDPDDAPSDLDLELTFSTTDGDDRSDEVADYWDDSNGSEDDCFESYAASFLVGGGDGEDDEHVALGYSNSESDYLSIDARVFADAEDAEDYFDIVADAAIECTDAGGYELYAEGEVNWSVSGVDVSDANELDLPDDVAGIIQNEDVAPDFADSYRVIMLQRDNVIVAITVQPAMDGEFDAGDGDELAELIAAELADL